jgi:hypothetical protein
MSEDEDLKRRIKQIEYELHQPENNYQKHTLIREPKKTGKPRLPLKYRFLIWFMIGLGIFTGLSFIVGAETLYLFFASVALFITSLSLIAILLISVLPMLALIYVIYQIYKWLV